MRRNERDILDVLRFELEFLEKGGYSRSPRQPWRYQFIFEDSPTCMNYDSKDHPGPCSECVLMQFVPPGSRDEKIPCRHIPFNAEGETLDSLYCNADQHETEKVFGNWLRTTIAKLEEERQAHRDDGNGPLGPGADVRKEDPLFKSLHPKCANPACPTAFHWLAGGKFFRFRPESAVSQPKDNAAQSPAGVPGVTHFWLCERCSQVFTLTYEENQGVMLKLLRSELPAVESRKQLTAA
jgi:hypothetical protein